MATKAMTGLTTSAENSMQPTSRSSSLPYSVKMARPLVDTAVNTRPRMPKGARLMTKRTAFVTASEASARKRLVESAAPLNAKPSTMAQNRMPRKLPLTIEPMGLETMLVSRFVKISAKLSGALSETASVSVMVTGKR